MNKIIHYIIAILLASSLPTVAYSKTYQWKLAESWPKDFPFYGEAVKSFIEITNKLSNGKLVIKSESSDVHKNPLGVFDMVKSGGYQMAHSSPTYWGDIDVNTLFFATVPFGMIATEQYAWFYHGGGYELMEKVYKKHGMLSFPGGNTGNQMGGWFRKEIQSVDDLKGLKLRIPGFGGKVMKSLGVDTVNLPPGELYQALESGNIDAVEWVGPSFDLGMGFYKVAPYYYTGWHEPASEQHFLVNQKAFDALPKDLQFVVTTALRLVAYDTYINIMDASSNNLKKMIADYPGIKIRAFPPEVIQALSKEYQKQIDTLVQGNPLTEEIIESLNQYKSKARLWTRISDQAFLNNAGL
ncbi:MAG: TRAP transporter substrate-binding protein [Cellvibrionaceae bacterium]